MNSLKKWILLGACIVFTSGCATILNDKTQKVNIVASNGQEFNGTVDGIPFNGPSVIELRRDREDKIILVETEGCNQQTLASRKVSNVFWINIITGGVFGSTTDYASEEMWGYEDNIVIACKG